MSSKAAKSAARQAVVECVGADKGNGGAKFYVLDSKKGIFFPSLASPSSRMLETSLEKAPDLPPVIIDGQPWFAGFNPGDSKHPTPVHSQRDTTIEHMAIFREGLDRIGADVIRTMVMGLPIEQFSEDGYVESLAQRYQGEHEVRGRVINVEVVHFQPEPLGTAWAYAADNASGLGEMTAIIADFGYGTTNLVMVTFRENRDGGFDIQIDPSTAVSLMKGASQVCEAASVAIKAKHSVTVTAGSISSMMHASNGDPGVITRAGQEIDLSAFVDTALKSHVGEVGSLIMETMRERWGQADKIIATGGFAQTMASRLQLGKTIDVMKDPMKANSRGLAYMAEAYGQR